MPRTIFKPGVKLLDRYVIEKEIHEGGMALIFQARYWKADSSNLKVAVKVISNHFIATLGGEEQRDSIQKRFLTEIETLEKLSKTNKYVVKVLDHGTLLNVFFLVMEFLNGGSLYDRFGRLTLHETIDIFIDLCEGLQQIHNAGVIHRDITGSNILLDSQNQPRFIDFGIVKIIDGALDISHEVTDFSLKGRDYDAPELNHSAKNASPSSDTYALGVTMIGCLTGKTDKADWEPRLKAAKVPASLIAIILKCTAFNCADRYQTALELKQALERELMRLSQRSEFTQTTHLSEEIASPGLSRQPDPDSSPLLSGKPAAEPTPIHYALATSARSSWRSPARVVVLSLALFATLLGVGYSQRSVIAHFFTNLIIPPPALDLLPSVTPTNLPEASPTFKASSGFQSEVLASATPSPLPATVQEPSAPAVTVSPTEQLVSPPTLPPSMTPRPEPTTTRTAVQSKDIEALLHDALLALNANNLVLAEDTLQKVLASAPDTATVHYYYAKLYALKGEETKAIPYLEKAHELEPAYRAYLADLALVYRAEKQYEAALKTYEKLQKLAPDDDWLRAEIDQVLLNIDQDAAHD